MDNIKAFAKRCSKRRCGKEAKRVREDKEGMQMGNDNTIKDESIERKLSDQQANISLNPQWEH